MGIKLELNEDVALSVARSVIEAKIKAREELTDFENLGNVETLVSELCDLATDEFNWFEDHKKENVTLQSALRFLNENNNHYEYCVEFVRLYKELKFEVNNDEETKALKKALTYIAKKD